MTRRPPLLRPVLLLALASTLLAACQTAPTGPAPAERKPSAASADATPVQTFERQQRERALAFERQGRWPEALEKWQVLALLDPSAYKGSLDTAQKRVDQAADEYLARARQEQRKGNTPAAEQLYLASLAMRPDQPEAADALRAIERARNQREFLRKPGRALPARGDTANRKATPPATAPASSDTILELEQANNLAAEGDLAEAVELLERALAKAPREESVKRLLVDLQLKLARKQQAADPAAARASVQKVLALEPKNTAALALAKQLGPAPTAR
jgi:tetratricopeptide (TPR) repeat protein